MMNFEAKQSMISIKDRNSTMVKEMKQLEFKGKGDKPQYTDIGELTGKIEEENEGYVPGSFVD